MIKLLLCALDGTLVETGTTNPLPGVRERLSELRAQSVAVAVVTNQGGVGYRYAYEQRGDRRQAARYPTLDAMCARLAAVAAELPISRFYVALHHGRRGWLIPENLAIHEIRELALMRGSWRLAWRKPPPGMLLQALADLGIEASEAVMIGNRPEDQTAAKTAGIPFQAAAEFYRAATEEKARTRNGY